MPLSRVVSSRSFAIASASLDRVKWRNDEVMLRRELSRRTFLVGNEWSEGRIRLDSEYTKSTQV